MIYVILGMHKSGTTLISQILHKSGINMGNFNEAVSYDQGNQYERSTSQKINREILKCGDSHSLDVIKPVHELPDTSKVPGLILTLVDKLNKKHLNWGFKDPRTCLSYPVWESYLPPHKVIYVYRNPLELWHHYRKYIPKRKYILRTVQGYKALKAWHIHNNMLLGYLNQKKHPYYIINFTKFMKDAEELNQLSKFTGLALHDCRRKSLYRSKPHQELMFKICVSQISRKESTSIEGVNAKLDLHRIKRLSEMEKYKETGEKNFI